MQKRTIVGCIYKFIVGNAQIEKNVRSAAMWIHRYVERYDNITVIDFTT